MQFIVCHCIANCQVVTFFYSRPSLKPGKVIGHQSTTTHSDRAAEFCLRGTRYLKIQAFV